MNEKTCLLDATVHTLCLKSFRNPDIPASVYDFESRVFREAFESNIGHDGSERGFHSQEIQDCLRKVGYLMQRHELYPCLQLPPEPGGNKVRVIPVYEKTDCADIFLSKINNNNGVLVCRWSNGVHHALSFQAGSNTAYHVQRDEFIPLEDLDIVMFLEFIPNENYQAG